MIMVNDSFNTTFIRPNESRAIEIVQALNFVISEARSFCLEVPARIVFVAKQDIIHWAANGGFSDQANEKLVRTNDTYGLMLAFELMAKYAAIKDADLKKEIIQEFLKIKEDMSDFSQNYKCGGAE